MCYSFICCKTKEIGIFFKSQNSYFFFRITSLYPAIVRYKLNYENISVFFPLKIGLYILQFWENSQNCEKKNLNCKIQICTIRKKVRFVSLYYSVNSQLQFFLLLLFSGGNRLQYITYLFEQWKQYYYEILWMFFMKEYNEYFLF